MPKAKNIAIVKLLSALADCVNTVVVLTFTVGRMTQALDGSNCEIARSRGKEAQLKPDELTNRNAIQG